MTLKNDDEKRRMKREAEACRRYRIRKDLVLSALQKQKRKKYLKKLQKGLVKPVSSMSDREYRTKKKQWRVC